MKREQCGELIVLFWCKGLTLWPLRVTDWVKGILSNFTLYMYQLFDFVLCFFCRSTTVLTSTLVYQTTNSLQQKGYVLYNSDFTIWSLQTLVRPQHPYCVKSHILMYLQQTDIGIGNDSQNLVPFCFGQNLVKRHIVIFPLGLDSYSPKIWIQEMF